MPAFKIHFLLNCSLNFFLLTKGNLLMLFADASLLPVSKTPETHKVDASKSKWNQWSPLSALTTKSEKKRTQDDDALGVSPYILQKKHNAIKFFLEPRSQSYRLKKSRFYRTWFQYLWQHEGRHLH